MSAGKIKLIFGALLRIGQEEARAHGGTGAQRANQGDCFENIWRILKTKGIETLIA